MADCLKYLLGYRQRQEKLEEDCVDAFKSKNECLAKQLLADLTRAPIRPAVVRTTFHSLFVVGKVVGKVSLLHLAAYRGWKDIAVCLVAVHNCSPMWKDEEGHISLHYAAYNGHLEVVKYFIAELHCDPMDKNKYYGTPLHYACQNGHLNIAQYLTSEAHCDPSCANKNGSTPLHIACSDGHLRIVQYLISKAGCDPSCENEYKRTPLHYACIMNHAHIVQYLLSTGRVNPLAKDKNDATPLSHATGEYSIVKLFQPFVDSSKDFPVHTFTKLILTGDSGAGKSTIAELIKLLANKASSAVAVDCVADVQRFTAGIIPHHIKSELGNFVVYDFAGQQEYYSSHAAVLEQVMHKSAAMFLCVIDLNKSIDNISQSLHYWLTFINNACSTAEETSYVAIVGSHVDQVKLSKEMEEKTSVLKAIVNSRVKRQKSLGYIWMDCRRADTAGSNKLISKLSNSHKAIATNQPSISYYCHVLYAFLHTKLGVVGCKLDDLMSAIARENDSSLPKDSSVLTELLTTLSDKGLILFIQHSQPKWVVVKTESLLNKINGELFGPHSLKVYPNLASSTGVISASSLHKVFDQYDKEMVIGFLTSLDFCRPVDPTVLQYTNLQTTLSHSTDDLLFFPGLVQSERPNSLTLHGTLQFGWCLGCVDRNQFFGSRFLHLLLLSVIYQFPLAVQFGTTSSLRGLQRRCSVWENGISWRDSDNITTVIELIDKNRWVLVAMSCSEDRPVEFAKLRSELISLVRHLQEEHCQSLKVCECLVSPSLVQRYPFDDLPDTDLFDIQDTAMSILRQKPSICSQNKNSLGYLSTQSLPFEPYHLISPSYVCQLFNSDVADQPVPAPLLQDVQNQFGILWKNLPVYKELREEIDKLSIFAGRNPLEVAGLKDEDLSIDTSSSYTCIIGSGDPSSILSTADLKSDVQTDIEQKEEDHIHSPTAGSGSGDPSSILSIDDLFKVQLSVNKVVSWKNLGLALGLHYPTLQKIEREQLGRIDDCLREMLAAWLQQQDNVSERGVPSWEVLRDGLKNIDENKLASKIDHILIRHTTQQSSVLSSQHDREVNTTHQSSVPSSQHKEVADHELKEEELPSTVVSPTAAGAGEPSSACRCCLWIILMLVIPVLLAVVAGFYLLY